MRAENASRVVKYANDNPLRFVDFSGFAAAEAQGKEAQLNTFLAREVDAGRMHKSQAILAGVFFRTKTVADIGGGAATTSANVLTVGGFGGVQRGTEEGRVTDLKSAARAFVEGNFTAIPGAEAALNAVAEGQGAGGALKAAAKDILAINEFGTVTDPTKSRGERAEAAFVGAIKVGALILGGKKVLTGKAPTGVIAEGAEGKAALETVAGRRFAPGAASADDPAFSQSVEQLFSEVDVPPSRGAAATRSRPAWLDEAERGSAFDKARQFDYPTRELYLDKPGGGYVRLDAYDPVAGEIVSRKLTQLGRVQQSTAMGYLNELATKYPPGARIANVPSSGPLAGRAISGQQILEVPIQTRPIPAAVLSEARRLNVVIRDVAGNVYR